MGTAFHDWSPGFDLLRSKLSQAIEQLRISRIANTIRKTIRNKNQLLVPRLPSCILQVVRFGEEQLMRNIAALIFVFGILASVNQSATAQDVKPATPPFPVFDSDAAWAKLPRDNPPLPPWAKVLVGPLPRTTAKMLDLEYLHRAKNPLGQELAGLLQWTVADAIGCKFGKANAEADLIRGKSQQQLERLKEKKKLAPDVQLAVSFARKLTLEGHAITDAEFAAILKVYGAEKVTAIVHTVAYANFHNRIVLGIGAEGESVPPVNVTFDPEKLAKVQAPSRPPWDDLKDVTANG